MNRLLNQLLFVILFELTMSQNCSIITDQEIIDLLYIYHPSFDEGQPNLFLVEYNITCLSHSIVQDHYSYVTASVKYVNSPQGFTMNQTFIAAMDVGCSYDNQWDSNVLGVTAFKWSDMVPSNVLRSDCSVCNGAVNNSDPVTHCVACHANCSVPNTLQGCYTINNTDHCCLVYSSSLCSKDCVDRQSANEQFVCRHIDEESNTETTTSLFLSYTITTQTSSVTLRPSVTSTLHNKRDFPTFLHLTIFLSGITCFVTVVLSVSMTLIIVICACGIKYCRSSTTSNSPVETMSSVGTVSEYVEPLTSPSTNTERSLVMSDSFIMRFNSSYLRGSGRYTSARRVPPVQYEDPDIVLDNMKNYRRPSAVTTRQPSLQQINTQVVNNNEHSYMTILA